MKVRVEKQIGDSLFSIETGYLAKQAAGACLVRYGDTVVISAVASGPPASRRRRFLSADLRLSRADRGGGKIPGRLLKARRPTDDEGNVNLAADGSADSPAISGRIFRRSADSIVRARQRSAERRRYLGDERRQCGSDALAIAVSGSDWLGAIGHDRRQVCRRFPRTINWKKANWI